MEVKAEKQLSPFDYISNLSMGSKSDHLLKDDSTASENDMSEKAKAYNAFMINRGFSYFSDSIYIANEMNRHASLHPRMQYDFYRHTIRPRKRFSKWTKSKTYDADVCAIAEMYGISKREASLYIDLYTKEQLDECRKYTSHGGK